MAMKTYINKSWAKKGALEDSHLRRLQEKVRDGELILLATDRDGTIVPICSRPEDAVIDPELSALLSSISAKANIVVAIVSARSVSHLCQDVDSTRIVLAGNYGLEVRFPEGQIWQHPETEPSLAALDQVKRYVETVLTKPYNTILDYHGLSLCMHWHLTPEDRLLEFHGIVDKLKHQNQNLIFVDRPTSYEVLPSVPWSKANALDLIQTKMGLSTGNFFPVYFGDSEADESAFLWTNEHDGLSVKVGGSETSSALLRLASPSDVKEILAALV